LEKKRTYCSVPTDSVFQQATSRQRPSTCPEIALRFSAIQQKSNLNVQADEAGNKHEIDPA
jgi:hypothetical protein